MKKLVVIVVMVLMVLIFVLCSNIKMVAKVKYGGGNCSMKCVEMDRTETSYEDGTFSVFRIDKQIFGMTLEPPDKENKVGISCIPAGQYIAKRINSPRHGDTFRVQNVTDRTYINFHPGTLMEHTEGCILLGESVRKLRGDRALKNSGNTFDTFMDIMGNDQEFHLTIRENY